MAIFRDFFGVFSWFFTLLLKTLIFDAIGMGFGRVLGGAGEGFGRVWEPLGRCWELPGLLFAVFRVSGSLLDAVGRSQGCCMLFLVFFLHFLYFLRRRRAERRERSERCEAPGLLFAVFRYFLLFLFIFDCFVIVWAVFKSSALALHASTALICLRASRSLLRQVFLVGSGRHFFRFFFSLLFRTWF